MLTWMAGHRIETCLRPAKPRYFVKVDGVVLVNKQRCTRTWGSRDAALKAARAHVHGLVVAERAARESRRQLEEMRRMHTRVFRGPPK